MFFKKKPKIHFIEYKPEEFEPRSEWLFWSLFIHLQDEVENLKNIFEQDDYKWSFLKKNALFETMLWSTGSSLAVLQEKLSEEEKDKLTQKFVFFLEMFFPNYKDYQIIDVISNYVVFAGHIKDHKKLRNELEEYFIERISKLFGLDKNQVDNKQNRDLLFMKFPHGWMLALDAFTSVTMKQVEKENQMARQRFRDVFIQAKEKFEKGETEVEKEEREKWGKNLDEFNRLVGDLKSSLDEEIEKREEAQNSLTEFFLNADIEKPLKEQLLEWIKKEKLVLSDVETEKLLKKAEEFLEKTERPRRQQVEKSLRKFLLQIKPDEPLNEQVIEWIKKEELYLSESDIEKFVDKAHSQYEDLQSNASRKKFFEK